jgi:Activator of Hsp90 ATPase homolog 1-like protein
VSRTGTQHSVDGRPALRFERRLAHPVERVWRAVSQPAELERWFVAVVPWTPAVGETFEAGGATGRITAVDEPRLLAWEWGSELYSFELSPFGDDGCLLVFTHVFTAEFGPDWQHAAGWETYFARLDAHLAGGFLSETDAHAGIDDLMAAYRADFGD